MKVGLEKLSAYQVASLRILSAGLILLPFSIRSFSMVPADKRPLVLLSGLLGTFFPAFLFCLAETRIDSSLAGILNALTPLFTLVIGALFFKSRIGWQKWIGVLIGFVGLVLLILSGGEGISFSYMGYAALIPLATLLYGINVNMVNRYLRDIGSIHLASVSFAFLILPALLILYLTGFFNAGEGSASILHISTLSGIVLGIIGTAAATILFYRLLKNAGPVLASMVTYGIPFVALFWGIMDGETIGLLQVGCLFMILGGVYLANK